ncbi:MAG TPA: DnaB-like helicase C-terminal domain-containing protein [Candidatus Wunengus sp. YC60]|uniref:DnaB-like helicase C-terminal domain-containing protein n=1 Tax=Candidatus Wunengus sp. YC60 TaxID=3367697 RepID=UPI0040250B50
MPEGKIFKYLYFIVRSWDECDETWINTKIQSALKRQETRERNLSEEIREYVLSTKGVFLSTDVHKDLDLSTRVHKKNCSEVLRRLVEEGIIERNGNKNGCFRRIENHVEIIDFQNTPADATLNIKLPFQIEDYVKIMPKNIIVVAGEPNAGKTAFLLNVVRMNMQDHEIYYFSSEMGALEMRDRLSKFELPLNEWRFKAIERASNFADVIRADAINIIDFLEIHDDFYKVGGLIKDIFDRLKSGVAFIAIQKNRGTDYGLGGMRSLEKPRLYLAMEPGKIKIVKGKNWANPEVNPNGLELDFKLVKGCRFISTSGWKKSDCGAFSLN